ncbi:MAG: phosphatase PAP2-related protein [Spirochaetota bacterium]
MRVKPAIDAAPVAFRPGFAEDELGKPSLSQAIGNPRSLLSFLALVLAAASWHPANELIHWLYPDRPIVPDLLFTLLPDLPWLSYLSEPLIAGSIAILLLQAFWIDRRRLPYYFFAIAALYFSRAFLMILTPLGRPTGNLSSYGIFESTGLLQHGMFPSGHQMLACMAYLLVDGIATRRLKRLALALALAQALVLMLSRGHYSIDIIGAALVSWFIAERMVKIEQYCSIEPVATERTDKTPRKPLSFTRCKQKIMFFLALNKQPCKSHRRP